MFDVYTGLLVRRAIRGTVIVIVVKSCRDPRLGDGTRDMDAKLVLDHASHRLSAIFGRIARIDPANKNSLKLASDPDARRGCRADWSLAGACRWCPRVCRKTDAHTPHRRRPARASPPATDTGRANARWASIAIALAPLVMSHDRTRDACPVSRTCLASRRRAAGARHRILQPVRVKSMSHV